MTVTLVTRHAQNATHPVPGTELVVTIKRKWNGGRRLKSGRVVAYEQQFQARAISYHATADTSLCIVEWKVYVPLLHREDVVLPLLNAIRNAGF